jgi:uncharacterized spore protein YtfJ
MAVSKAFSFEPMFCESVGIAAGGGVSGAGYGGEAAEVVLYAFALLMFRAKDVRLWPLEERRGSLFERGKRGSLRRH